MTSVRSFGWRGLFLCYNSDTFINVSEFFLPDFLYALDIGTRKVAGLVGRRTPKGVEVIALEVREHRERSMVDGQVHDVLAVASVVMEVTRALSEKVGAPLQEVALAAAGRALRTAEGASFLDHSPFEPITAQDVRFLERLALQDALKGSGASDRYHCVGYVPVRWLLDGAEVKSLEGHRGRRLEVSILATFLPNLVLEGLLGVAQAAGLKATCLTLEPIAALEAVVPPDLRMLNLALVDVGAGTSDIALVKGGAVVAFAMVPIAGDEVTEALCEKFLMDFYQAELLKRSLSNGDGFEKLSAKDIFGNVLSVNRNEARQAAEGAVADLSRVVADRILELNQGSPAAVVLVGGGSVTHGLPEKLSSDLNLESRRIGIRKPNQSHDIDDRTGFLTEAWGVTPAGILLIAARQKGLLIQHVRLNGTPYSLLKMDESVSVLDLLAQTGETLSSSVALEGPELSFTLNGAVRKIPGHPGRPAVLRINGKPGMLGEALPKDAEVTYIPAELGKPGCMTVGQLRDEFGDVACFLNGMPVALKAFVSINGRPASSEEIVPANANVEFVRSTRLADVLESQGFEIGGEVSRQILVSVNGDPRYLTQRNFILKANQREVEFDYQVQQGDVIEFGRNTQFHYRVRDVVTSPREGTPLKLVVNGQSFTLKGEPGQIFMNGHSVLEDEFVIDHATLITRDGKSSIGTVAHLLAQMEPPKPSATGQRLLIHVDGLAAGFTTSLKEGSNILIRFE
jgi:cell division protein FtsA